MQLQLTWQLLLMLPFLIIGMTYGWRRGPQEEAVTTLVLLAALLFFGNERLADLTGLLVNNIVGVFGLFFSGLLGRDINTRPLVTAENQTAVRFIGYSVFVAAAYLIGSALGRRKGLSNMLRAVGSLLGSLNIVLIATQMFSFIQGWLPQVFQREGTIRISPDSDSAALRSSLPSLFAVLLVILLVVVFLRLPKIRH